MGSLNRVILMGNLTRDPESRNFDQGAVLSNLGLAINEYYKNKQGVKVETTCYVDVVVWGPQAEACNKYLNKGAPVLIEGRLQYESWEAEGGGKRSKIKVKADRVQFLSTNKNGSAPGGKADKQETAAF